MPTRRQRRWGVNLSPTDAQEVLQELVRDGRISAGDISRYREIRQLEQRLQSLRGGGGAKRPASPREPRLRRQRRRSSKITAEQLASRQLQGRYLGLIRQVPASQRGRYKKMVKERGREAAIREIQNALKK